MAKKDFFDTLQPAFVEPAATEVKAEEVKPADTATVVTEAKPTEAKPAEITTEVKTEEPPTVAPPAEPKFDIAFFNKLYKTDFKSEDDIRGIIERSSKASDLEKQLKEYETLKADIDFYKKGVNPLDYFASEDDYRIQQFKKQYPDKDPSVAYKLFNSDLNKEGDFDLLVQYELMSGGVDGGEATAKQLVGKKYDIDDVDNPAEWSPLTKTLLKREANKVRNEIGTLKSEIKLPDIVNLSEKRAAEEKKQADELANLTKGWEDIMPKMVADLKEIDIKDVSNDGKEEPLLKYVMEDEVKQEMGKAIKEHLIANRIPINEQTVREVGTSMLKEYVWQNLPKLLKAYANPLLAALDKAKDEETHNPTVIKTEKKPDTLTEDEKRKKELTQALIGAGKFKYNKPF